MATLANIHLDVGRNARSGLEYADVQYDVGFSPAEIRLNVGFNELVGLFEIDSLVDLPLVQQIIARQYMVFPPAQRMARDEHLDQFVGQIFPELRDQPYRFMESDKFHPSGANTVHRRKYREWDFGHNERGNEEFQALVVVVPEVMYAAAMSNPVTLDVG